MTHLGTHTWVVIASEKETQTTMFDGLAKKTNPIQIGITGGTTVNFTKATGIVRMTMDSPLIMQTQLTTTDTPTDTMVEMMAVQMTTSCVITEKQSHRIG